VEALPAPSQHGHAPVQLPGLTVTAYPVVAAAADGAEGPAAAGAAAGAAAPAPPSSSWPVRRSDAVSPRHVSGLSSDPRPPAVAAVEEALVAAYGVMPFHLTRIHPQPWYQRQQQQPAPPPRPSPWGASNGVVSGSGVGAAAAVC
jgi:hypothetical protein